MFITLLLPGVAPFLSTPFAVQLPTLAEVILGGQSLSINKMCFWLDNQPLVELISWQPPRSGTVLHLLGLFVLCSLWFEHTVIFKESSRILLIKLLMFFPSFRARNSRCQCPVGSYKARCFSRALKYN